MDRVMGKDQHETRNAVYNLSSSKIEGLIVIKFGAKCIAYFPMNMCVYPGGSSTSQGGLYYSNG